MNGFEDRQFNVAGTLVMCEFGQVKKMLSQVRRIAACSQVFGSARDRYSAEGHCVRYRY
jgi:hypothetical protein